MLPLPSGGYDEDDPKSGYNTVYSDMMEVRPSSDVLIFFSLSCSSRHRCVLHHQPQLSLPPPPTVRRRFRFGGEMWQCSPFLPVRALIHRASRTEFDLLLLLNCSSRRRCVLHHQPPLSLPPSPTVLRRRYRRSHEMNAAALLDCTPKLPKAQQFLPCRQPWPCSCASLHCRCRSWSWP